MDTRKFRSDKSFAEKKRRRLKKKNTRTLVQITSNMALEGLLESLEEYDEINHQIVRKEIEKAKH